MKKRFYNIFTNKKIGDKKFAIVSDFHISKNTTDKKITEVLEVLEQLKPTHIFIPGDLYNVDNRTFSLTDNPVSKFIINATDIAKVYYVKGNIEQKNSLLPTNLYINCDPRFHLMCMSYAWMSFELQEHTDYMISDDDINITGILFPKDFYSYSDDEKINHILSEFCSYLENLSNDCGKEKFNILLCHDPIIKDVLDKMDLNFDLVVAGHNHGGLFPKWMKGYFTRSGVDMEKLYPKYIKGILPCGNGSMIVSEGITKFHSESGKLEKLEVFHEGTIETVRVRTRK